MAQVTIRPVTGKDDLYCVYQGQVDPQDCYIELDTRSGRMHADYNPEIGNAVPCEVYYGEIRHYAIPALKAETANELMEQIRPLAQRVADGTEIVWNGHNHVAKLSQDAQDAEDEIGQSLEGIEQDINVENAYEWLYDAKADIKERISNGETLEAIGISLQDEAMGEDVILTALDHFLDDLAEEVADEADEQ